MMVQQPHYTYIQKKMKKTFKKSSINPKMAFLCLPHLGSDPQFVPPHELVSGDLPTGTTGESYCPRIPQAQVRYHFHAYWGLVREQGMGLKTFLL